MIFSFFGPPGSGKGTLAQKLVQQCKYQMLSTGNLCREHVANETDFGKQLDYYLKQGALIPDDLITDMVIDWIQCKTASCDPIILDGFPRTRGQAEKFLDFLNTKTTYQFRVVLVELSEEEIVRRLSSRIVCSNKHCQTSYTERSGLINCEFCQEKLVKRSDDKEEVVRERLKLYPVYRDALFQFYKKIGLCIEQLNINDLTPDQVYSLFLKQMNAHCE